MMSSNERPSSIQTLGLWRRGISMPPTISGVLTINTFHTPLEVTLMPKLG